MRLWSARPLWPSLCFLLRELRRELTDTWSDFYRCLAQIPATCLNVDRPCPKLSFVASTGQSFHCLSVISGNWKVKLSCPRESQNGSQGFFSRAGSWLASSSLWMSKRFPRGDRRHLLSASETRQFLQSSQQIRAPNSWPSLNAMYHVQQPG